MQRTKVLTGLALVAALSACAGRSPNPVATSQAQDVSLACPMIHSEIASNNQRIQQLSREKSGKTAQNVIAGTAGVFIPVLWFAMDFQGTQNIEINALQGRNNALAGLTTTKCATVVTAPPAAPTPAPAPIYTYSQPPHPDYQPPATYEAELTTPVQAYQPPTVRAKPAIAPYNPPQAALGRPAPKDDFWDRPHDASAVDRSASATPEPVAYPIDPCTAYQNDNIARVRCEWISGPQRAEYVPPAGEGAPLDVQISCLPVRDRSQQYGNCIAQGYL